MIRALFIYFVISSTFVIYWAIAKQELKFDQVELFRRFVISITIGLFVVVPYLVGMTYSNIIVMQGDRIALKGKHTAERIALDIKINGVKNIKKHDKWTKRYIKAGNRYIAKAFRYKQFTESTLSYLARWLGANYV